MKEVKLKRVMGPYSKVPFKNYIQSPIGLVPKAGGQTRLIFHLSYDFGPNERSVNHHTAKELCSVRYCNLDHAVRNFLNLYEQTVLQGYHNSSHESCDQQPVIVIYSGKGNLKSASGGSH